MKLRIVERVKLIKSALGEMVEAIESALGEMVKAIESALGEMVEGKNHRYNSKEYVCKHVEDGFPEPSCGCKKLDWRQEDRCNDVVYDLG